MDTALTSSIVRTASAAAQREASGAVHIAVLKKAIDLQADAAATLLQALPPVPAAARPAADGTLGTHVNTYT